MSARRKSNPRKGGTVQRSGKFVSVWRRMLGRRPWMRVTAYLIGAVVFLLHVFTLKTPSFIRDLFAADMRDVVYHSGMLTLFALTYRLSLTTPANGRRVPGFLAPADAATLVVCSGWGAVCELVQVPMHPYRNFSVLELGLNMAAPLVLVTVLTIARHVHSAARDR